LIAPTAACSAAAHSRRACSPARSSRGRASRRISARQRTGAAVVWAVARAGFGARRRRGRAREDRSGGRHPRGRALAAGSANSSSCTPSRRTWPVAPIPTECCGCASRCRWNQPHQRLAARGRRRLDAGRHGMAEAVCRRRGCSSSRRTSRQADPGACSSRTTTPTTWGSPVATRASRLRAVWMAEHAHRSSASFLAPTRGPRDAHPWLPAPARRGGGRPARGRAWRHREWYGGWPPLGHGRRTVGRRAGRGRWRVIETGGHGRATVPVRPGARLLISGDQVLPTISRT